MGYAGKGKIKNRLWKVRKMKINLDFFLNSVTFTGKREYI